MEVEKWKQTRQWASRASEIFGDTPVRHDGDISAVHIDIEDILYKRVKHETKNYFTKAEKTAQT